MIVYATTDYYEIQLLRKLFEEKQTMGKTHARPTSSSVEGEDIGGTRQIDVEGQLPSNSSLDSSISINSI